MEHLQKHAIMAYFVGGRQRAQVVTQWIATLQAEVGAWMGVGRDLGRGFFQVYIKSLATTQKILMLTPHRSKWGTCILQSWASNFNSSQPTGLKVPTWITLKDVPGEFLGVVAEIASGLGDLVDSDKCNTYCSDQKFYVALKSGDGYRAQVAVKNKGTGTISKINIDYGNLPIRCRFCLALEHLIKDCSALAKKKKDGDGRGGSKADASSKSIAKDSATSPPNPAEAQRQNPDNPDDREVGRGVE
jgi:hypothetical protein